MRYEPQGEARYAKVDLAAVRLRLGHRQRTPYEIVFSAYVKVLRHRDFEAAALLNKLLRILRDEERGEQ